MSNDNESSDFSSVGLRMREVRLQHDYSQSKVAAKLDINDRTYKFYELGKREVPLLIAMKFCKEFGIEIKWLSSGLGPKKAEGNDSLTAQAAEALLDALGIEISMGGRGLSNAMLAKQIDFVLQQSLIKGTSPKIEAEALASIIVPDK